MTAKRDTSRQKRVNQNRSAREALVARRQAAAQTQAQAQKVVAEPEPAAKRSRFAGRTRAPAETTAPQRQPEAKSGGGTSRAQAAPVVPAKRRSSRFAAANRPAAAPAAVEPDEPPASGLIARAMQLAGGRQMLAAFALVVAGAPLSAFVPYRETDGGASESLVTRHGAGALIVLVPIVIAAVPLLTMNNRHRRLAWNGAAFLLGLWVISTAPQFLNLLAMVAMVWGLMKNSRAERPVARRPSRFMRPRPGADDDSDAVIDAAATDAESGRAND